jgi:hypothetical protein
MRARHPEFVQALAAGRRAPLVLVVVWTAQGARIYTRAHVPDAELWTEASYRVDGTRTWDGSWTLGAGFLPVIGREARLLELTPLREEVGPLPIIGAAGDRVRRVAGVEVSLRNDDDHFGKLLAGDSFLSARLTVVVGVEGLRRDRFVPRFQGVVHSQRLAERCTLWAEAA